VEIIYFTVNQFETKIKGITLPEIELLLPTTVENDEKFSNLPIVINIEKKIKDKTKKCPKGTQKNKKTGECLVKNKSEK
jgi:hypothetical protein